MPRLRQLGPGLLANLISYSMNWHVFLIAVMHLTASNCVFAQNTILKPDNEIGWATVLPTEKDLKDIAVQPSKAARFSICVKILARTSPKPSIPEKFFPFEPSLQDEQESNQLQSQCLQQQSFL